MDDPRELLDAYAAQDPFDGDAGRVTRQDAAPELFAAMRAVLGLHPPFTLTDSTRNPKPVGCDHCSEVPNFVDWPCPTVQAVITALEVDCG